MIIRAASYLSFAADEVVDALRWLPDEFSSADPMPTLIRKPGIFLVDPYIAVNQEAGSFSRAF
jgi:hypothetical protein